MRCAKTRRSRRNLVAPCLVAIGLLMAGTPAAHAGFNRWTSGGPWVGGTLAFAAHPYDPQTAYAAGQYTGLFRTRDGGATWQPIEEGLTDLWITALAIDPVAPSTIYAASYGKFVYKSTDGGDHWVSLYRIDPQGMDGFATTMAIDPFSPSTLYVGMLHGVGSRPTAGAAGRSPTRASPTPRCSLSPSIPPTLRSCLPAPSSAAGSAAPTEGNPGHLRSPCRPTRWSTSSRSIPPIPRSSTRRRATSSTP